MELVWQTASASAANASANASGRIEAEGLLATPRVVVAQREAVASFCGVRVRAARMGTYTLGARVQGAGRVLASSAPVQVIGHGRVLEIVRGRASAGRLGRTAEGRRRGARAGRYPAEETSSSRRPSRRPCRTPRRMRGRRGLSARNVTGELHPDSTLALSGPDGVARLTLWLRRWGRGWGSLRSAPARCSRATCSLRPSPSGRQSRPLKSSQSRRPRRCSLQSGSGRCSVPRTSRSACRPPAHTLAPPPAFPDLTTSASIPAPAAAPHVKWRCSA